MGRWSGVDSSRWSRKRYSARWAPEPVYIPEYVFDLEDEDDTTELIYIFMDDVPDEYIDAFKKWLKAQNQFQVIYRKVDKPDLSEEKTWMGTKAINWENWYSWYIGETDKRPKPVGRYD